MIRILALDPSGTGTTGVCLIGEEIAFQEFRSPEWKNHLQFIRNLLKIFHSPDLILYENTHYLKAPNQDAVSLLKLLGALESLPVRTESVLVNQVKDLKSKVFKGTKQIPHLTFKPGREWFYDQQRISLHCLDAFLVYYLWKEQNA